MVFKSQAYTMRLIKVILFLAFFNAASAQINTVYSIGSVGLNGSTAAVYSGPVVLDAAVCIKIASGLSAYNATQPGLFVNSCIVPVFSNREIKLVSYPNPVTNTLWVKSETLLPESSSKVNIEMVLPDGKSLAKFPVTINELNAGYKINMMSNPAGVYFLQVVSANNQRQQIKVIKTN
jgi:hypothetical protein